MSKMLALLLLIFLVACSNEGTTENSITTPSPDISIEEAKMQVPFVINEPNIPFKVTKSTARVLNTNKTFDAVEMTYENSTDMLFLVLTVNDSKIETPENGRKTIKLNNGSQVWEQSDENVSAIFWRFEALNYTLISWKHSDSKGNIKALYNHQELVNIANSIQESN